MKNCWTDIFTQVMALSLNDNRQGTGTNPCTDGFFMLCGYIHSGAGPRSEQRQGPVLAPDGSQTYVRSETDAGFRFWSICCIPHLFLVWGCVNAEDSPSPCPSPSPLSLSMNEAYNFAISS